MCMNEISSIGQVVKGKAQQIKGELKQNTSRDPATDIAGGIDKVKGKINEAVGKSRLRTPR